MEENYFIHIVKVLKENSCKPRFPYIKEKPFTINCIKTKTYKKKTNKRCVRFLNRKLQNIREHLKVT